MRNSFQAGKEGFKGQRRHPCESCSSAFTLLELCFVLVIIALLIGCFVPNMITAMTEQTIRNDSNQLALMVKTAMIQSSEQNRPYVIDFTTSNMMLHPLVVATADGATSGKTLLPPADPDAAPPAPEGVEISSQFSAPTQLVVPNPEKPKMWMPVPKASSWLFRPGELCPAKSVRFTRGEAYLEVNFNALTGDVDQENYYFP